MIEKQCARRRCPLCYESWMNREANSMTRRITKMMQISHRKVSHVDISLPKSMYQLSIKQINKKIKPILKKAGILGGSKVLHPFRFHDKKSWVPYVSPHFHLICFGWILNTAEIHEKTGIIINKISTLYNETDVFRTSKYQLTHCGIKDGKDAVVYFGSISYSKLKVEKEEKESVTCPYCPLELVHLRINPQYLDKPPPFELGFTGLTSFSGFVPIEKYNIVYYDEYWREITTSKEMALQKKLNSEKLKLIHQKKLQIQQRKSKLCCTLNNWIQ